MIPELVYCPIGEECKQYTTENYQCVIIRTFVSLDGSSGFVHTIFNGIDYMQQQNYWVLYVENSSMSTAERGTYDGHSCFEVYKYFNSKVVCRNQKAFSYPY